MFYRLRAALVIALFFTVVTAQSGNGKPARKPAKAAEPSFLMGTCLKSSEADPTKSTFVYVLENVTRAGSKETAVLLPMNALSPTGFDAEMKLRHWPTRYKDLSQDPKTLPKVIRQKLIGNTWHSVTTKVLPPLH
ncbi:MAG: hypothetical protein WCO52_01420 [bacterium]